MFTFKIGLAVWLLVAASAAVADPFAPEDLSWLNKMIFAARHADYSGTFIYQSGSYVETSRITHLLEGENEYERLESLDGERSEIIRKNDQVWCYQGDKKQMVAKRAGVRTFPALLPEQLSLLQENYLISHVEEDRVAGFRAHGIIFHPRDKMRYSHKMWAHSDSGLLLKSVVLDEHDHIIEQYAFTQLNLGGDIERKWIVMNKSTDQSVAGNAISSPNAHMTHNESGWIVYALPVGFKKITEVSRVLKGSQLPVTQLVFSDGLAGISVFIEKLGDKPAANAGLYSKGVIQVFTRVLDANLLTVVGEVPARTVMQVAESVRYGGLPK
jgi:sigma-E factor negative regulatory protein RseB